MLKRHRGGILQLLDAPRNWGVDRPKRFAWRDFLALKKALA